MAPSQIFKGLFGYVQLQERETDVSDEHTVSVFRIEK
jgi:hypothetical protein